ncbi:MULTISPECIES: helix-turn-helix domain-containing protein [Pseudomonadota]|jgi:Helix-turn-helix.|uniref:helix-turn-helix domain-containing protein n=1 Tax=Pseudomonadota TaxID=1224 RepID=UPI000764B0F6|nr:MULTISPECIES: helix-turn-helix transcriptional regulator [Pseudomonadota]MCA0324803.1 helix-turn-helix domain-containing protein [Pseudomonadota bacterium]HRE85525.1 helix-turn-helix transcriptional regulator [Accumulibacter sp.]ELE9794186.1 helix-turn-helix transcriptional regulator [Pseudomonas aeruginosa]MBA0231696.1 XRE family transcriptional regulator [Stenotrophomonas maltophilia]MBK6747127.1 helix-turn-helix transcriptional regulator [Ottowia sp.]
MTAFSESFRSEVARIARKENKGEMSSLRKTATNQRAEIATLKRDLKDLAGQVRSLAKALQKSLTAAERQQPRRQSPDSSAGTPAAANRRGRAFVFSHEALVAKRQAFHMTQKEMAQLLGVSSLSVYKWETGRVTPREAQLVRVREVLQMGVREARRQIPE